MATPQYNPNQLVAQAIAYHYVLTPVPNSLTIHWDDAANYYFDEVSDGSSLVWVDLMIVTFREQFPTVQWMVDDPGTLYDQFNDFDGVSSSPYSMETLQSCAQLVLARYKELFTRLVAAGIPVA